MLHASEWVDARIPVPAVINPSRESKIPQCVPKSDQNGVYLRSPQVCMPMSSSLSRRRDHHRTIRSNDGPVECHGQKKRSKDRYRSYERDQGIYVHRERRSHPRRSRIQNRRRKSTDGYVGNRKSPLRRHSGEPDPRRIKDRRRDDCRKTRSPERMLDVNYAKEKHDSKYKKLEDPNEGVQLDTSRQEKVSGLLDAYDNLFGAVGIQVSKPKTIYEYERMMEGKPIQPWLDDVLEVDDEPSNNLRKRSDAINPDEPRSVENPTDANIDINDQVDEIDEYLSSIGLAGDTPASGVMKRGGNRPTINSFEFETLHGSGIIEGVSSIEDGAAVSPGDIGAKSSTNIDISRKEENDTYHAEFIAVMKTLKKSNENLHGTTGPIYVSDIPTPLSEVVTYEEENDYALEQIDSSSDDEDMNVKDVAVVTADLSSRKSLDPHQIELMTFKELSESFVSKKELLPVDHSKINYPKIIKNVYKEVKEISKMTDQEVQNFRLLNGDIRCRGKCCPRPVSKFVQLGIDIRVIRTLNRKGISHMLPVQMQAIPISMCGRDIITTAVTGSGKTLSYIIPLIRHVCCNLASSDSLPGTEAARVRRLEQFFRSDGNGPGGLVIVPTRELAAQVYSVCSTLSQSVGLVTVAAYGGGDLAEQIRKLKRGCDILISTPGRLIDVLTISNGKVTHLSRVTYVVIDEADRMFDLGFEPQISMILRNINPERQVAMFSATFPQHIQSLAMKLLHKPIQLTVGYSTDISTGVTCEGGIVQTAASNIYQSVLLVNNETERLFKLLEILGLWADKGSIIIFVNAQIEVDDLFVLLLKYGYGCITLHAGQDSLDRQINIRDFKKHPFQENYSSIHVPLTLANVISPNILITTSLAARGLDVDHVLCVVNYTAPSHIEDYIHRIGRTGRAGATGHAFTILSKDSQTDKTVSPSLIDTLRSSGQGKSITAGLEEMGENEIMRRAMRGIRVSTLSGYKGKGFKFTSDEYGSTKMLAVTDMKKDEDTADDDDTPVSEENVSKVIPDEKRKVDTATLTGGSTSTLYHKQINLVLPRAPSSAPPPKPLSSPPHPISNPTRDHMTDKKNILCVSCIEPEQNQKMNGHSEPTEGIPLEGPIKPKSDTNTTHFRRRISSDVTSPRTSSNSDSTHSTAENTKRSSDRKTENEVDSKRKNKKPKSKFDLITETSPAQKFKPLINSEPSERPIPITCSGVTPESNGQKLHPQGNSGSIVASADSSIASTDAKSNSAMSLLTDKNSLAVLLKRTAESIGNIEVTAARLAPDEMLGEIVINDYPEKARRGVQLRTYRAEIEERTNTTLQLKGQWYSEGSVIPEGCRALYMQIIGKSEFQINLAKRMLYSKLEEEAKATLNILDTNKIRTDKKQRRKRRVLW